jgi:cytochrome P450
MTTRNDPPGPRGWPLIGVAFEFRRDPLRLLMQSVATYGDIVQLPLFRLPMTPLEPSQRLYIISHPALARQICLTNRHKYRTHQQLVERLKLVLNLDNGELLTSIGEEWLRRKSTLQPAFSDCAAWVGTIARSATALADRWDRLTSGCAIDIDTEMTQFATKILASLFLGLDLEGEDRDLASHWYTTLDGFSRRMAVPLKFMLAVPHRANREYHASLALVEHRINSLIRERKQCSHGFTDVLSMWLTTANAKNDAPAEKSTRDQVMLLLLAGRKNVSNALTWACHQLARHPDVAARAGAEADRDACEPGPYITAVQKEVLRLYPTAWLIARRCLEDDTVGGYRIPQGATIFISPYAIHRREEFWPEPERFDPERFLNDSARAITADAYLPFGVGPRMCIGSAMTNWIMRITLSVLCARFTFEPLSNQTVRIKAKSSLYPDGGLRLAIRKRHRVEQKEHIAVASAL